MKVTGNMNETSDVAGYYYSKDDGVTWEQNIKEYSSTFPLTKMPSYVGEIVGNDFVIKGNKLTISENCYTNSLGDSLIIANAYIPIDLSQISRDKEIEIKLNIQERGLNGSENCFVGIITDTTETPSFLDSGSIFNAIGTQEKDYTTIIKGRKKAIFTFSISYKQIRL